MKDAIYNLINPVTNEVLQYGFTLNEKEVQKFNDAFALNQVNKRYVNERDMVYTPSTN
jgi:hypothetical protein